MNLNGPHAGKENLRIIGIHFEMSTATVLICKEHAFPCFPAIDSAENTSFLLWAISVPEGSNENDVRILRIDDDSTDTTGLFQSHQCPRLARIC